MTTEQKKLHEQNLTSKQKTASEQMSYQAMLNSSELAVKVYENHREIFEGLESQQRVTLVQKHLDLLITLIKDDNNQSWSSSVFTMKALFHPSVAHALYYAKRFDGLEGGSQIELLKANPTFARHFVEEGRIHQLSGYYLSEFVTNVCIKYPKKKNEGVFHNYSANFIEEDRDYLTLCIAEHPALIAKLNPAARILLLARLKKIGNKKPYQPDPEPELANNSPFKINWDSPRFWSSQTRRLNDISEFNIADEVWEQASEADDIPLNWEKMGRSFWLAALGNMSCGKSFYSEFNHLLDSALCTNCFNHYAKPLALAAVIDERFLSVQQYGHYARYGLTSLERRRLIIANGLSERINSYREFTDTLNKLAKQAEQTRQYHELLADAKLAVEVYRNAREHFDALKEWQKIELLKRTPGLMIIMLEEGKELNFMLQKTGFLRSGIMKDYSIIQYTALNNKDVALALYNKPAIFQQLPEWEQVEIILSHPELAKQFAVDGRLNQIKDLEEVSKFVTCICVKSLCVVYGKNLNDADRDEICINIAKNPEVLLKLNPAARMLLLSRLKQSQIAKQSSHNQSNQSNQADNKEKLDLPNYLQMAVNDAYILPLDWDTIRAFWIMVLGNMTYSNDYVGRFNDVLDCAYSRNNYFYVPRVQAEALALTLLLDPQFINGYPSQYNPSRILAKLSDEERERLTRSYNLIPKIESYKQLTTALESKIKAEIDAKKQAEEAKAKAIEEARKAESARKAALEKIAEEAKKAEEVKRAEEIKRAEELKRVEELKRAEEAKRAEELKRSEEARKAIAAKEAEEQAKKLEEIKKAEEARKAKDAIEAEQANKAREEKVREEKARLEAEKIKASQAANRAPIDDQYFMSAAVFSAASRVPSNIPANASSARANISDSAEAANSKGKNNRNVGYCTIL